LGDAEGFGEAFGVGDGFGDGFGLGEGLGVGDRRGFGVGRGVAGGVGVRTASSESVGETVGGGAVGAGGFGASGVGGGGVERAGVGSGGDGSGGFSISGGPVSFDSALGGGVSSGFPADAISPVSGLPPNEPGLTQTIFSSLLPGWDNETNTSPPSNSRWTNAVAAKMSLKRPSYS